MRSSVVIDIDGVLADFEGAFCRKFGFNHREYVELERRYPLKAYEIDLFVNSPLTYANLDILPLGVEIAKWFYDNKFDIHLISSRPEQLLTKTAFWLKRNKIPFHFLQVGVQTKLGSVLRINPVVAIDDMLKFVLSYADFDIPSLLIDQPWNQEENLPLSVRRIKNFSDFLAAMDTILKTDRGV
jgi:5'(3')-deoxyribonucleotidase